MGNFDFLMPKPGTRYTHDGRVLHHNNCTYCKHRFDVKARRKGRRTMVTHEICRLTNLDIPEPETGLRLCESYQQKGCECDACSVFIDKQLVFTIDNEAKK